MSCLPSLIVVRHSFDTFSSQLDHPLNDSILKKREKNCHHILYREVEENVLPIPRQHVSLASLIFLSRPATIHTHTDFDTISFSIRFFCFSDIFIFKHSLKRLKECFQPLGLLANGINDPCLYLDQGFLSSLWELSYWKRATISYVNFLSVNVVQLWWHWFTHCF